MNYRRLGKSGIKVSEISLGSWRTFGGEIDQETTEACMVAAYDAGVNFFDGAEVYAGGAAEDAMGKVFRKHDWPRDSLVISSKVLWAGDGPNQHGLSRKHLVEACDAALQRLGLDYLDLFFCHWPDPDTPLEETVETMDQLIQRGKILYWGTSNYTGAELMQAYGIAEAHNFVPPTMDQVCYNMFKRDLLEENLKRPIEKKGLGTTVFSPMAIGVLSGKYNDGFADDGHYSRATPEKRENSGYLSADQLGQSRALGKLAAELGISQANLALAWCLKNPAVSTVLTGASRPEQVLENVKSVDAVALLDTEVMERIEKILK